MFPMLIHGVDPGWQLLWGPSGLWVFVCPDGVLDPCYPIQHPCGLSGGIRSQKRGCSSVALASQESWQASDVRHLGSKFVFKVSKGWDCKNKRKILPKNTDTVSLHLASRCHSPAQNNHQKALQRLCSFTSELSVIWTLPEARVRTLGHRCWPALHWVLWDGTMSNTRHLNCMPSCLNSRKGLLWSMLCYCIF